MQKIIALCLAGMALIGLFGCGSQGTYTDDKQHRIENHTSEKYTSNEDVFIVPNKEIRELYTLTSYDYAGVIGLGHCPVYEISIEEGDIEEGADYTTFSEAYEVLENQLPDTDFYIYIVNEDHIMIGYGGNGLEYTRYEFSETYLGLETPPYQIPFNFYFTKYFKDIDVTRIEYRESITDDGTALQYILSVTVPKDANKTRCQKAAQEIVDLMDWTIGIENEIVVRVYNGKEYIAYATSWPLIED